MQGAMQILCAHFRLTKGEEGVDDEGVSYNGWRLGWRKRMIRLRFLGTNRLAEQQINYKRLNFRQKTDLSHSPKPN